MSDTEKSSEAEKSLKEPEKTKTYTFVIFAVFLIIIGIITLLISFNIDKTINDNQKDCTSKDLRNSNIGVMITSTVLVCLSASYIGCITRCDCKQLKNIDKYVTGNPTYFSMLLMILGIVLIAFGSIISKNSDKCSDVKSKSKYIWGMGLFVLLISIVMIVLCFLKNKKK